MTAVLFVIDKVLEWAWSGYRERLNQAFPLAVRRKILRRVLFVFVFVSGFLAWKDEHYQVDEKQKEIDRQARELATSPWKEIDRLTKANDDLRAEVFDLREQGMPLQLTAQQQEQVANRLRIEAGTSFVVTFIDALGEEAVGRYGYAEHFVAAFRKAGWEGPEKPQWVSGSLWRGVFIFMKDSEKSTRVRQLLQDAFAGAGVRHVTFKGLEEFEEFRSRSGLKESDIEGVHVVLLVGARPYLNE